MFGLIGPGRRFPGQTVGVAGSPDIKLHLEPLEERECPATLVWTGKAPVEPGQPRLWSNQNNWAPVAVPTADDTLVFKNTGNTDSTQDILENVTLTSLLFQDGYTSELTVPTTITVRQLVITGAGTAPTIGGNGDLVIASGGSWTWEAGGKVTACTTTISANASAWIKDTGGDFSGTYVHNRGTVTVNSTANFQLGSQTFVNEAGSGFVVDSGAVAPLVINGNGATFVVAAGSTLTLAHKAVIESKVTTEINGTVAANPSVTTGLTVKGPSTWTDATVNVGQRVVVFAAGSTHDITRLTVTSGTVQVGTDDETAPSPFTAPTSSGRRRSSTKPTARSPGTVRSGSAGRRRFTTGTGPAGRARTTASRSRWLRTGSSPFTAASR